MARLALSLFLLSCVLLQNTLADFGSLGTVQSSGLIKSAADASTALYNELDDKNDLELQTDYELFSTVLDLLTSLGTQFTELGTTLTIAISDAVPNKGNNLDAVFDPIADAVENLLALIDGEQASTRTTLTQRLGSDINVLFGDVFGNMRNAISAVGSSMVNLKQGLSSAIILNGRNRVDRSLVSAVQTAMNTLRATIEPSRYVIHTGIENIELADQFLKELEDISINLQTDLDQFYDDFTDSLETLGTDTADLRDGMLDVWDSITDEVRSITFSLSTLPEYPTFEEAETKFGEAYSALEAIDGKVAQVFSDYLTTADTYLEQFEPLLVPRDYDSIKELLEVLVSSGPYSQFCFFKFSVVLINLYSSLVSDVEGCFNLELSRLDSLYLIAESIIELLTFDLEDLPANLQVCESSSATGPCLAAIGPYYTTLAEKTLGKINLYEQLTNAEATASVNRLGACIVTFKLKNVQHLMSQPDIATCRVDGPNEPEGAPLPDPVE